MHQWRIGNYLNQLSSLSSTNFPFTFVTKKNIAAIAAEPLTKNRMELLLTYFLLTTLSNNNTAAIVPSVPQKMTRVLTDDYQKKDSGSQSGAIPWYFGIDRKSNQKTECAAS